MLLNQGFDTARAQSTTHNTSGQPPFGLAGRVRAYFSTGRADAELHRFVKLHGPFGRFLP